MPEFVRGFGTCSRGFICVGGGMEAEGCVQFFASIEDR